MVDGQVFGALLAEQLQDAFGPRATLRNLHFRFKNLVFAGETVQCTARVTAISPDPDGDGELVVVESTVEVVDAGGEVDAHRRRTGRGDRGGAAVTQVAFTGAAECDLGRTGRSVLELQVQAVTRALADAGLTLAEVDGLATNSVGRFATTEVADQLGIRPAWVDSSFVGGSAFESYVARAAQAIVAGQASVIVVSFASNQRSARSRSLGGVVEDAMPAAQFETPYAPLYPLSYYAMAAQAYLHRYELSREHLAHVAVSARDWALLNPAAFRHDAGPLTVADVLAADPVSTPLSTADCCLVTDGGGAVVITRLDRARDLPSAGRAFSATAGERPRPV